MQQKTGGKKPMKLKASSLKQSRQNERRDTLLCQSWADSAKPEESCNFINNLMSTNQTTCMKQPISERHIMKVTQEETESPNIKEIEYSIKPYT